MGFDVQPGIQRQTFNMSIVDGIVLNSMDVVLRHKTSSSSSRKFILNLFIFINAG